MNGGRTEILRAERVRAAVEKATVQDSRPANIGRRIEELLGESLNSYPDEIMSLDLLPTMDGFQFIGWTADFEPVECRQDLLGDKLMINASMPLVGWKPKRQKPLTGKIFIPLKFSL